jgi:hypothetical protein
VRYKSAFAGAYLAAYAGFNFRAVEFATVLPVVSCGGSVPGSTPGWPHAKLSCLRKFPLCERRTNRATVPGPAPGH